MKHRLPTLLIAAALLPGALIPSVRAATGPAVEPAAAARAQTLLRGANQFWAQAFNAGDSYKPALLALFDHEIRNVCSASGPLTGPFYCPDEMKVYLDQHFLQQIAQRSPAAEADFALAYVIGHELGLHIQNLVGTTQLVEQARDNSSPALATRTWMTQELQADCFAGLWVRSAIKRGALKPVADAGAVLDAVSAIAQQVEAQPPKGATMFDPLLTYGTPAQRLAWFQRGMDSGRFNDCDTFSAQAAGKL